MKPMRRLIIFTLCMTCVLLMIAGMAHAQEHAKQPTEIGRTTRGRPVVAFRFGNGPVKRVLIGGIHGGYEWNTVHLMSRTLEYLGENPAEVPAHVTLYIVPNMNPDGYDAGTDRVTGRMNANGVDLNRNWDFNWSKEAWHGRWPVSGGEAPFSEPESRAVRDFIMTQDIKSVIFYHSAFAAVFPGANLHLSNTEALAKVVAGATGYRYLPGGIPGQTMNGNAIDWLSGQGIDAIDVELTNHSDLDWERNLRGIRAFLAWPESTIEDTIDRKPRNQ